MSKRCLFRWKVDFSTTIWRLFWQNCGAEIDVLVTSTSFRQIISHGEGRLRLDQTGKCRVSLDDGTFVPRPARRLTLCARQPAYFQNCGVDNVFLFCSISYWKSVTFVEKNTRNHMLYSFCYIWKCFPCFAVLCSRLDGLLSIKPGRSRREMLSDSLGLGNSHKSGWNFGTPWSNGQTRKQVSSGLQLITIVFLENKTCALI